MANKVQRQTWQGLRPSTIYVLVVIVEFCMKHEKKENAEIKGKAKIYNIRYLNISICMHTIISHWIGLILHIV